MHPEHGDLGAPDDEGDSRKRPGHRNEFDALLSSTPLEPPVESTVTDGAKSIYRAKEKKKPRTDSSGETGESQALSGLRVGEAARIEADKSLARVFDRALSRRLLTAGQASLLVATSEAVYAGKLEPNDAVATLRRGIPQLRGPLSAANLDDEGMALMILGAVILVMACGAPLVTSAVSSTAQGIGAGAGTAVAGVGVQSEIRHRAEEPSYRERNAATLMQAYARHPTTLFFKQQSDDAHKLARLRSDYERLSRERDDLDAVISSIDHRRPRLAEVASWLDLQSSTRQQDDGMQRLAGLLVTAEAVRLEIVTSSLKDDAVRLAHELRQVGDEAKQIHQHMTKRQTRKPLSFGL